MCIDSNHEADLLTESKRPFFFLFLSMGLLVSSLSTIALHNTRMASTIAQLFSGRLPLDALLVIGVDQHVGSLNDLNVAGFKSPSRAQYSAMTVLASLSCCSPGADLFQRVPQNIRVGASHLERASPSPLVPSIARNDLYLFTSLSCPTS